MKAITKGYALDGIYIGRTSDRTCNLPLSGKFKFMLESSDILVQLIDKSILLVYLRFKVFYLSLQVAYDKLLLWVKGLLYGSTYFRFSGDLSCRH